MNTDEKVIEVKGLEKSFDDIEVLKGIDIDIHKGEVVVIEESFGIRVTEIIKES